MRLKKADAAYKYVKAHVGEWVNAYDIARACRLTKHEVVVNLREYSDVEREVFGYNPPETIYKYTGENNDTTNT